MFTWLPDLIRAGLHLIFPANCIYCGASVPLERTTFCAACESRLQDTRECCPRCASTVGPFSITEGMCVDCHKSHPPFAGAVRYGVYSPQSTLSHLILRLKRAEYEWLSELMGEIWARRDYLRFSLLAVDVVVPVPLHPWRRFIRGYNQSEALARGLARILALPCKTSWLRRSRHTPRQVGKSAEERRKNVIGAFRAQKVPEKISILLVDDVLTTGATASEATKALLEAGASRVIVAILGRAES